VSAPKLLDLYSGSNGAGQGYTNADWDVYSVDNNVRRLELNPNPSHAGDVIDVLATLLAGGAVGFTHKDGRVEWLTLTDFDAIHASPPCQGYTALAAVHGNEWPKLVEPVRFLLDMTGLPYVIENVQGSPVRRDMTLCGEMFGLSVIRHRYFELGRWAGIAPVHKAHRGRVAGMRHGEWFTGPYFAVYGEGGGKGTVAQWQAAMGIDWTDVRHEIAEAIPPAYTEHIGHQLLEHIASERVAA
jgi:site-specific DNA-cytosine methylase